MSVEFRAPLVLSVLLFASLPTEASAAGVSGKATFVKGTVERGVLDRETKNLRYEELKRGARIRESDLIRTGDSSRVELTFADGSRLRLPSKTTMQVGVYRGGRPGMPSEVNITAGSVWAQISKAVGGDVRFAIRTPNAVAGVRGTTLTVTLLPDGRTATVVTEGVVGVTSTTAKDAIEQLVKAGEGLLVLPSGEKVNMKEVMAESAAMLEPGWAEWNAERDGTPPETIELDPEEPPKEGDAPKKTGDLDVGEDLSKLSPSDLKIRADTMMREMNAKLQEGLELITTARRQKDIVKLNCLNDKITPMKGVIKVASDATAAVGAAVLAGNEGDARSNFTKVALAQSRVSQLRVQANNCVGSESYYGGTTESTMGTNPSLTGANTFFGDRTGNPADDYANGNRDTGDNTGTDSPPFPNNSTVLRPTPGATP